MLILGVIIIEGNWTLKSKTTRMFTNKCTFLKQVKMLSTKIKAVKTNIYYTEAIYFI